MTGKHSPSISEPNYVKAAAEYLRSAAKERGIGIGSSHAHALVAASLGYHSKKSFLSPTSDHFEGDPWLYTESPNRPEIGAAVSRMKNSALTQDHVPFLADTIRDGLAPPCSESGRRSAENVPLGYVNRGDEATNVEWVHPSEARNRNRFGHCKCCGSAYIYRVEELDAKGLCEAHEGEFDLDEEEQRDLDDLVENLTKDN